MNAKEINRESEPMFKILLMPNWARRSQEDQEDYGVDFELEVMSREDKATGIIFKAQLKGTSVAEFNSQGELVFSKASVKRFNYYLSNLKIPIIFVVCDVNTGLCYWIRVQGNRKLEGDHAEAVAKNQETFTIKIPTSQRLLKTPESADKILEVVEDTSNLITLRGLQGLSAATLRKHLADESDLEATERQLRLFAGITANETIQKLLLAGDVDAACQKAQNLLESPSETPEVRILGGWNLANCINVALRRRRTPGAGFESAKYKIGIASRMLEVARSNECETRLKRYCCIFARAARMQINGRSAMALATSESVQAFQGETMSGPITRLHRMEVSAGVARDFFKLRNSLIRLGNDGYFSVMPYALAEVVESIVPYVSSLRVTGNNELADAYVDALFDFVSFALGIVRRFNNQTDSEAILSSLGLRLLALADVSNSASMPALLHRYESALEGDPAFDCLGNVLESLRKQVAEIGFESREHKKPTLEELRHFYAERATELGINLSDPDDKIAEIVRIGLEDLDPTPVSKNCKHIHVVVGSYGMPGEMLGLPTAGSKRVVCLKHGHAIEGLKLNSTYESFRKSWPWDTESVRCENCPDVSPHPEGWEWSDEWEAEQHTKYQDMMKTEMEDFK